MLYDLDEEARQLCDALGLSMVRSRTVGIHPRFVGMLRELIAERIGAPSSPGPCGRPYGPSHDVCPETCCLPPPRTRAAPVQLPATSEQSARPPRIANQLTQTSPGQSPLLGFYRGNLLRGEVESDNKLDSTIFVLPACALQDTEQPCWPCRWNRQ